MINPYIELVTLTPSRLCEGDVYNDPTAGRAVEVRELYPIVITYCGVSTPVWYVRGYDTRPLKGNRVIKTVLVPRTPVQVILRRGGVVTPAG